MNLQGDNIMNKIEISNKVPFECSINGVKLEIRDLVSLHEFYEASCTAEFLRDNYGFKEEEALELGYDVRQLMDDYDLSEIDAIDEVFEKRGLNKDDKDI